MASIFPPRRLWLLAAALLSACAAGEGVERPALRGAAPEVTGAFGSYLAGRYATNEADTKYAADSLLQALRRDPNEPEVVQRAFIATLLDGRSEAARLARVIPNEPLAAMLLAGQDALVAAGADVDALPLLAVSDLAHVDERPVEYAWALDRLRGLFGERLLDVGCVLNRAWCAPQLASRFEERWYLNLAYEPLEDIGKATMLVGDARAILTQLTRALAGYSISSAYRAKIARVRTTWSATRAALVAPRRDAPGLTQAQVIDAVNTACGATGTAVHASGGIPGDIHKLWRSLAPNDYHSEYGYSCMGYEIAGALGVKLADPRREVFAFLGDGSYLMLHTEIVTAVQEGLKLIVIVNDNHGFGCIHNLQRGSGGKSFGNEFRQRLGKPGRLEGKPVDVDFAKNAESLGATGLRAHTLAELTAALTTAQAATGTVVIHVTVRADVGLPGYSWWDVPGSATSRLASVRAASKAYGRAITKQKFYY